LGDHRNRGADLTSDKANTDRIKRVYGTADYAELAGEYDKWAHEYDMDLKSLGFTGPKKTAETLARYITNSGSRILDAGAGTGLVGEELAELGFNRVTALDLSPGMLMVANDKFVYEELRVGELGKPLEFETGQFDATTCVGTLTINHAPPASLDELVRVTKPGGRVVFTMRTDHYKEGGFEAKQAQLEQDGKWKLLERGEKFQPMPDGEPDIWYEIWTYEVL
jgi:ubiquinone/menaquinone biosynthesis C-methylase UbiE